MCLLLGFTQWTFAQTIQVRGKVTDDTGDAVIGASVLQKGTINGTATDLNGNFTLSVPGNATLTVSYLGYVPKDVQVNNQTNLTIQIQEDVRQLDEVVVTGYTTQRKIDLTGSIASISNKDLTITKNENVVNALAGKLPGLRISQKNSRPGDYASSINIRGYDIAPGVTNATGGGVSFNPLYVIDGVARDYDYFARMDPEEVESISILKDASAAIYGMRAANGVILVTTRRGTAQQGKVDISYSGSYTAQEFIRVPRNVTPTEFFTLQNESAFRGFNYNNFFKISSPRNDKDRFEMWEGKEAVNWMDAVFKKVTPQNQHNLNLSGGTEQLRYFMSLGYMHQDGNYKSGSLYSDRYNFRSNVDANITNRLKMSVSVAAILDNTHEPNGADWTTYKNVWLHHPTGTIYANNNPLYLNGDNTVVSDGANSVAQTDHRIAGYNVREGRRLNGTMAVTYDVPGVKGLQAKASYSYGLVNPVNTNFKKKYSLYTYKAATATADEYYQATVNRNPSTIQRSTNNDKSMNSQIGLNYSNIFGYHSVGGVLLFEEYFSEWDNFSASRETSFDQPYLSIADNNAQQRATGGTPNERTSQSVVGQFNYGFAGKYLADVRFRYEGTSRFPKNNRWGFFPSVSLGWRFSEEGFIKNNLDFISNLKLRGSWGEVGDDTGAGNYPQIYASYNLDPSNLGWYFNGTTLTAGTSPPPIANLNLTWFVSTMKDIALEFGLFNNKVSGVLDFFRRDRSGLMATSNNVIPNSIGASLPLENLNADRTFGWEFELTHNNRINGLNYFVTGNISATRHMRTKWTETPASNSYDHWRNRSDGRYTQIWWRREAGNVFTSRDEIINFTQYPISQGALPGDGWFKDWNGDGIINDDDRMPYATQGLALVNAGLSFGANFKNFDLSLHFQGAYGINAQYAEVMTEALPFGGDKNALAWFLDRWRPADITDDWWNTRTQWISGHYPVTGGDFQRSESNGVEDMSYIRMKTLELGYSIPKSLLSKIGVKNLRVYVNGYNLLTLSKMSNIDPERPGSQTGVGTSSDYVDFYSYPNNKTYTVGVNIKF